tara:strand:+ start:73 stop:456 length:384 start_codon:yes stop_codon:yes gene_type:complete
MAQYDHNSSPNRQGLAHRIPGFSAIMSAIALMVTGINMSLSIFFNIGFYEVFATADVVSSQNNARSTVNELEQKVTLTETLVPNRTTNGAPQVGPKCYLSLILPEWMLRLSRQLMPNHYIYGPRRTN